MTLIILALLTAFGGMCCIAAPRIIDDAHLDDPLHWVDEERREDRIVAWTMLGIAALIVATVLLGVNAIRLI